GRSGLGRVDAEVGVLGQRGGTSAGALGEVPLGQGLHPPSDPLEQPGLVVAGRRLTEDFGILLLQLLDGHPRQGGDLALDVQMHDWLRCWDLANRQPVWTLSLGSARTSRPSGSDSGGFSGPGSWPGSAGGVAGAWRRR